LGASQFYKQTEQGFEQFIWVKNFVNLAVLKHKIAITTLTIGKNQIKIIKKLDKSRIKCSNGKMTAALCR